MLDQAEVRDEVRPLPAAGESGTKLAGNRGESVTGEMAHSASAIAQTDQTVSQPIHRRGHPGISDRCVLTLRDDAVLLKLEPVAQVDEPLELVAHRAHEQVALATEQVPLDNPNRLAPPALGDAHSDQARKEGEEVGVQTRLAHLERAGSKHPSVKRARAAMRREGGRADLRSGTSSSSSGAGWIG